MGARFIPDKYKRINLRYLRDQKNQPNDTRTPEHLIMFRTLTLETPKSDTKLRAFTVELPQEIDTDALLEQLAVHYPCKVYWGLNKDGIVVVLDHHTKWGPVMTLTKKIICGLLGE